MHPDIADMVSKVFYAGELKTADREFLASQRRHRLRAPAELRGKALVWLDVPPVDVDDDARDEPAAGGGFTNGYEIRALQGFLRLLEGNKMDAAILSPYRAQVRLMQQKFFDTWHHPVTGSLADRIFTIDSFQGRQASLVGVTLVRNNHNARQSSALGFVTNKARATVMFSRAERLLVVVGCSAHFKRFQRSSPDQGYVIETFNYIERHGEVLQAYNYLRREDIAALADYRTRRS
jgi:superfamily I DNA and/or RNA helicase